MTGIDTLRQLLSTPKKIVITTHQNPDGDAMGSSLGLYQYLIKKGHSVTVITPTGYPEFLKWMKGHQEVVVFTWHVAKCRTLVADAEIIFCLDFNALSRIGDLGDMVAQATAAKVMIDHHLEPQPFPDYMLSDITASSTCELIHDFILMLGDHHLIDTDMAESLYTGLLTDTGGFQHPNTTAKVMRICSDLMEKNIRASWIYHTVFDNFTESRLRLFGYCINDKMKVLPELKTAIISLNAEELVRFNVKSGDTEGIVNYPLKIAGLNLSVFVVDRTENIKLSFRSIGDFDVNTFARKHFNGGGHRNASGGSSTDTLFTTLKKLEAVLPDYKNDLDY